MTGYYEVGKIINGVLSWTLVKKYDDTYKKSLQDAIKSGLYIEGFVRESRRTTYMPVTNFKRRFNDVPVLTYSNGEIDLQTAVRSRILHFGPSHDVNAAQEKKGLAEDEDDADKKRQAARLAAIAADKQQRADYVAKNKQQAEKRLKDDKERQEQLQNFADFRSGTGEYAPALAAPAPAPAPADDDAVAAASPAAVPHDDVAAADAAFAFAKRNNPSLTREFYDHMTIGGKRNKSRKPKRRNSRSKRRNSRSKRRKTLNKSRH